MNLQVRAVVALAVYGLVAWFVLQLMGILFSYAALQVIFVLLVLGGPVVWMRFAVDDPRKPLSRVARIFKPIGYFSLALIIVLYCWPDEHLTDDSMRLMDFANHRSTDSFAFSYGMYGLDAPAGTDMWAHGRSQVTHFNVVGWLPENTRGGLSYPRDVEGIAADALPDALVEHGELLARFDSLALTQDFTPAIYTRAETPMPAFQVLRGAHALRLREVEMLAERGDFERAWRLLDAALAFPRRMVGEGTDVVTKIHGARMFHDGLQTYVNVLMQSEGGAPFVPARLTPAERSFVTAFSYEPGIGSFDLSMLATRQSVRRMMGMSGWDGVVMGVVPYLPARTMNTFSRYAKEAAIYTTLEAPAAVEAATTWAIFETPEKDWWTNTLGAFIINTAMSNFAPYGLRMHDLDARLVLAQVAVALHAQGATAENVEEILAALPAELRSPYDGALPGWESGRLVFTASAHDAGAFNPALVLPIR